MTSQALTNVEKLRKIDVSVKAYGAMGDGVTDDTSAILSAINAVKALGGGVVNFPVGNYLHTGLAVSSLSCVTLRSAGGAPFASGGGIGAKLICTSATANHLYLTNPYAVKVENLLFQTATGLTPTAGTVITFFANLGSSASCSVTNCRLENHFNGIALDGCSNSEIVNTQVRQSKGVYAIELRAGSKRMDQIRLTDVISDTEVTLGSTTALGVSITTDVHTVFIERCSMLKCRFGYFLGAGSEFVRIHNSDAESSNQSGFVLNNTLFPWLDCVYASINREHGILVDAAFVSTVNIDSPDCRGNALHGILINSPGAQLITIATPRIGQNSNPGAGGTAAVCHGIAAAIGASRFQIMGGKCGGDINLSGTGTQAYGILVQAGASNRYVIANVDLSGNTTGTLSDGGSGTTKTITGNLL